MSSNDWGVSDETFSRPEDEDYQLWCELQPECPECGGDGEVPGGIAGEYERTCPRCDGTGVENCEFGEGD